MGKQHKHLLTKLFIGLCCLTLLFSPAVNAEATIGEKPLIKVGFYEYAPYYYKDDRGQPQGYYHALLAHFARKLDFDYEYVEVSPAEILPKLESGEIDFGFGAVYKPERARKFVYSREPLQFESNAIYVRETGTYGELENLNGQTIGYLSEETHHTVFADQITALGLKVNLVPVTTYQALKDQFFTGTFDAIITTNKNPDFEGFPTIYSFSTGPVYILTTPENRVLLNRIDNYIQAAENQFFNPVLNIYNSYFNQSQRKQDFLLGMSVILLLLLAIVLIAFGHRDIKQLLLRRKIRRQLKKQQYCVYYQPIINHETATIASFEALVRLQKHGEIISPYHFLPEIEQAKMMYPLTLWMFEQVVRDYPQLKQLNPAKQPSVSINVSFVELSQPDFVATVLAILAPSQLAPQNFCFEIVEREKLGNPQHVIAVMETLRAHGFQIALDDFGTEYSNFDILERVPYDVLKLDKYLVDELESSHLKQAIIRFLVSLAQSAGKRVIIEGIETQAQLAFMQQFPSDIVFIQGYYYSPPQPLAKLVTWQPQ